MSLFARLLTFSLLAISVSAAPRAPSRHTTSSTHRATSTSTPAPSPTVEIPIFLPPDTEACQALGQVFKTILTGVSSIAAPVFALHGQAGDGSLSKPEADIQNALVVTSIMTNSSFLTATQFEALRGISTDMNLIAAAEYDTISMSLLLSDQNLRNNADDADALVHLTQLWAKAISSFNCTLSSNIVPELTTATTTETTTATSAGPSD